MEPCDEILPGFSVEAFLADHPHWDPETKRGYRNCLNKLRTFSQERGALDRTILQQWRQALDQTYQARSVYFHMVVANQYFRWCHRPDLVQSNGQGVYQAAELPRLSREEYLTLLRTARRRQQRRTYLLVKLFVLTGLPLQYLEQVTVELLQQDHGAISCQTKEQTFVCPAVFRQELLDYSAARQLTQGPIFVTRSGRLINRSHLCRDLQELCRQAGIPEEKGNPRCLRTLYRDTRADIEETLNKIGKNMYEQLLAGEQQLIAWSGD